MMCRMVSFLKTARRIILRRRMVLTALAAGAGVFASSVMQVSTLAVCFAALFPFALRAKKRGLCAALFLTALLYGGTVVSLSPAFACAAAVPFLICAVLHRQCAFSCVLLCVFLMFFGYTGLRSVQPEGRTAMRGTLTATVSRQPVQQRNRVLLTLDDAVCDGIPLGRVRVYVYGGTTETPEYGDDILLEKASVTVPKGQTNPNGFDFSEYLWRDGVGYCANASAENVVVTEKHFSLMRTLGRVRALLARRIDELYGDNADVMRAILLGDRSTLDEQVYDDFRAAGVAHLIALSGLHVSCIALLLGALLKVLLVPKKISHGLIMLFLTVYACMTGMSPSVERAVLMYGFLSASRIFGWPCDTLTRLSGAFLVQLTLNPLQMKDSAFSLSYTTVLGLICLAKLIYQLFPRNEQRLRTRAEKNILQICAASASTQLAATPLIASCFGMFPVLALPVNLIAIPMGLTTVYTGMAAVVLSLFCMEAGKLLAYPGIWVWSALKYLTGLVEKLPFSSLTVRVWPLWAGMLFFACMAAASPYCALSRGKRRHALAAMLVLCFAVFLLPVRRFDGVRVVFLDVGYGDGVVIETHGEAYVVDCGRDNGTLEDYLVSSGLNVSGIFVTHPDTDHAGGLAGILSRYPYANVYLPYCWDDMDVGDAVKQALTEANVHWLYAGDSVRLNRDVQARVLWPPQEFVPDEDNDGSLVLNVNCLGKDFLLTGDLTDAFDALAVEDCDVIKVAHHGSKFATTEEMLSVATPEYAVISVAPNSYGHPTQEVLERLDRIGARVFRTDTHGAVTFEVSAEEPIRVTTMLSPEE